MQSVFTGPVYVVRDNIDTDQIIPAQYLTLVPTIPDEYEKLGSHALCGLPESLYPERFIKSGKLDSEYPIVVAGKNFGCGSSREHAPIALGSAKCKVVLAESFARIFFRNSINIGLPIIESKEAADRIRAKDTVKVDTKAGVIKNLTRKESYRIEKYPPFMQKIFAAGGLMESLRRRGNKGK